MLREFQKQIEELRKQLENGGGEADRYKIDCTGVAFKQSNCSSGDDGEDDSEGEEQVDGGEQAVGWDGTKQPKARRRSSKTAKLKHHVSWCDSVHGFSDLTSLASQGEGCGDSSTDRTGETTAAVAKGHGR